jgi:hypothetical protein
MNTGEKTEGCDLRDKCGFYCNFVRRNSGKWQTLVKNYCQGSLHPLCARRLYYQNTGKCAPFNMVPTGVLPEDLLKLD